MKINASLTDFPVYVSLETFFKEFKQTGIDGLEIVGGYKNRWSFDKLFFLAKEYDLPIRSFHQPIWSGIGAYFDEDFFKNIAKRNVQYVTFHPLAFHSFEDFQMKKYFSRMAQIQEEYGIHMLLENMPDDLGYRKLFQSYKNKKIHQHLEKIYELGHEYGFLFTFDISHAELVDPTREQAFIQMFPSIAAIHLSSFTTEKHHLPLTQGDFQLSPLLTFLKKKRYKGELTLEVNENIFRRVFLPYDFESIKDSVDYFRRITDKLS